MTIKYLDAKRIRGVKGEESSTMGTSGDVTEVGGVTLNSTYKVFGSNSIDLDGTNDAYLNMDGVLNAMSTTGTVSYWVRNGDGTAGYFLTFNRSDNSGGSSAITYMHSEHHTHLSKMDTTLNIGNSIQWQVRSPTDSWSSSDRGWHHVVLTQDGTAVKFYFDGTEQPSFTITTDKSKWISDLTSRDNVRFGVKNIYAQGNVGEFTGQVDDIAIWDRAITAAEVTTLYGGGQASGTPVTALGISRTGLKAYWSCNSLDGTTLPNEAASIAEDKATLVTAADTYTRQSSRMNSEEFVTVSGGKLQFTLPTGDRGGYTTSYGGDTITFDIGVLSDTAWVARCKLTLTTADLNDTDASMNGCALWLSDNAIGNVDVAGQDWASIFGLRAQNADGNSATGAMIGGRIRDNNDPEIAFNTGDSNTPVTGTANVNADTYYIQATRDGDDLVTTIGTDAYGGTTGGGTQTVTQANVTGLRYLKFTAFTEYRSAGDPDGTVVGNVDDFSIDDGVTTWATADKTIALAASTDLPENTLFEETDTRDTYWLQTLDGTVGWFPTWYDTFVSNKGWTTDNSSTTNIDTTNRLLNVIDLKAFYIEIPELDTKWVADLDIYWDNIGSNQEYIVFGSYGNNNYPSGTGNPQYISIRMEEGNGTLRETIRCTQFVGSETNTNDSSKISGTVSDTWYYYRLVRDGDGVTLTRYSSDANRQSNTSGASCAYPDFVGDIGWVESTKIKYITTTGYSANCNFDVKNIRIYNGVTSV